MRNGCLSMRGYISSPSPQPSPKGRWGIYIRPECMVVEVEPLALLAESEVTFTFGTRVNDAWEDDEDRVIE